MSEEPQNCPFCGGRPVSECTPGYLVCVDCGFSATGKHWNRLAVVSDGWVLVPEEPTAPMQVAAGGAELNDPQSFISMSDDYGIKVASHDQIYRAMIAAAPKPRED